MVQRICRWSLLTLLLLPWWPAPSLRACPFCSAVSQTFSEEMEAMDVAAIVSLVHAAPIPTSDQADQDLEKSRFKVESVLKGTELVAAGTPIEVIYFGKAEPGTKFLIMGADAPNFAWSTPLQISDRAEAYLKRLPGLPKDHRRLEFFQTYLQDKDQLLAMDSYDEFAKTPYAGVIALKDKMQREKIIEWIQDKEVATGHRRLYLTMLGVCGQPEDSQILEQLLKSKNREDKRGLDAMIACYLILRGADGMPLVEDTFLRSKDADYADTYSAIMALRFHGTEADAIPRERLLQAMRVMLDRPELADLVIPDLARWEDWSVMPQLVQLFKDANDDSIWVRVPVINYLRACPKPEAKAAIEELAKVDPDAVKRAQTFFAFGGKVAAKRPDDDGSQKESGSDQPAAPKDESAAPTTAKP